MQGATYQREVRSPFFVQKNNAIQKVGQRKERLKNGIQGVSACIYIITFIDVNLTWFNYFFHFLNSQILIVFSLLISFLKFEVSTLLFS